MRLKLQFASLVAFITFATSCSTPAAGDTCSTAGFLCESAASALECRLGSWVALPCKGVNGCKREGSLVKCDMALNVENDACASSAEGKGLCTADGLGTLECRDGKLIKTNSCRTCSVAGDLVTCQP